MEVLERLKILLRIEEDLQDELLLLILEQSKSKILNKLYPFGIPNNETAVLPKQYEYLQLNIAVYLYNKMGAEGQTSHSENGISRGYESADVPISMLQDITPMIGKII